MAYDALEPFGELRADFRNGLLISTIMAIMGQQAKPQDFMMLPKDEMGRLEQANAHPSVATFEAMFGELNEGDA